MKRFATFAALAACAGSALAAPETYVIDANQTASLFSYRALGMSSQTHRFEKISGKVVLDQASKTGSADVTIDATSVNTGHAVFDKAIQTADFFDTARHPVITFKSTRLTLDGEQPGLAGDLTIKGVTKPVTLAVSQFKCTTDATFNAETCGAQASVTIKRSDFNMGKFALLAGDDITLNLTIRAVKKPALLQVASRDPVR